ncbi:MAG: TIGR00730 family Rossman fold protein [Caldilineae bacterium]|nr:MAG: TIGR00730 family Rossman fold protein [Caldilineae bacterium]
MLRRICVFCGSNPGANGAYVAAARRLGELLARDGLELVYGGGMTGIMGALADAALAAGARVVGVIPQAMVVPRVVHEGLSELRVTPDMHTRKATMYELADAFIALPGGFGTFDELFETITWSQLGYLPKPIGLLNVSGYFDPLLALIDQAVREGFVKENQRHVVVCHSEPEALLMALRTFRHPAGDKWPDS